jgi:hypothetical protein
VTSIEAGRRLYQQTHHPDPQPSQPVPNDHDNGVATGRDLYRARRGDDDARIRLLHRRGGERLRQLYAAAAGIDNAGDDLGGDAA